MPSRERQHRKERLPNPNSLFTPLRRKVIVAAIAAGNHYHTAAAAAGVSYDTLQQWLEKGRDRLGVYVQFVKDCEEAEAQSEMLALKIIQESAQGFVKTIKRTTSGPEGNTTMVEEVEERDWRAAAFLMERRWSNRWSLARKLQFSGALDVRRHVIVHTDPADMQRIIEAEEGVLLLEGKDGERSVLDEGPESDPDRS